MRTNIKPSRGRSQTSGSSAGSRWERTCSPRGPCISGSGPRGVSMSRSYSKAGLAITQGQSRYLSPWSPKGMGTSQDWCQRPLPARSTVTDWMEAQSPIRMPPHVFSPMAHTAHRKSSIPGPFSGMTRTGVVCLWRGRYFTRCTWGPLLVVNLGSDLHPGPAPEPLLAPPEGMDWTILWSSEDPRYGGDGVTPLEDEANWHVPGHNATVLRPHRGSRAQGAPLTPYS
jgi:hypothetical protein